MSNNPDVQFRFSQPSGAPARKPSKAMADALQRLSQADEVQNLIAEAQAQGRKVVVQVYHSGEDVHS